MPLIISLTGEHYERVIVNLNDGRCGQLVLTTDY